MLRIGVAAIVVAVVLSALLTAVLTAVPAHAAGEMQDVYEILNHHYDAIGGLERLQAESTTHFEATLTVMGLSGTIKAWEARPDRNRTEVDLTVFAQTTGDNGSTAWEVGTNGKLTIEQDEFALARRDVSRRLALFEHLDPDSEVFTATLEGIESVGGADCYAVRVASAPDDGFRVWYIDTADFLMRKSVSSESDMEQHALFSDYRDVNGVLHAFHHDIEILPLGQKQTLDVTLFETGIDIDPALFDPPSDAADDFVFTGGGSFAEVPCQYIERHIFLPVEVDGDKRLWVLDSGASVSVLDKDYALSLGFELSGEIKGQGAGNTVDVAFTTLPGFSVDGIEFEEQQVAAIELESLFRRISDIEVVGILGYDFLSRFVTKVDYANELLTFYDPTEFEYAGEGTVLDAPLSDNLFSVRASVDGVHDGRWMLDLGAGGVTIHSPYAKEHDLRSRPGVYGVGFGAGGRILHYMSKYETIEFGGLTIQDPHISASGYDGGTTGAFSRGDRIGNLGNTLFRHLVLYLDYENQRVIVEKGDDFGTEFPWDSSGLQIWRPDDVCEVLYVSPGTPAEDAGFVEGDLVISVDGVAAADVGDLLRFRELLRAEPGTEYVFRVERDGVQQDLTLVLRDLFE